MEFIRGLHNLAPRHRGGTVTIGNFDGVHLGHQAVIRMLREQARARALPTTVVIFEPQPLEFLRPQAAPPRLTRLSEKVAALDGCGVDRVLCLHFNAVLAALAPEDFVQRVLIDGLGLRYLVIGDDFRFGAGRRGDFTLLQSVAHRNGFEVAATPSVVAGDLRISSTAIREALTAGDFAAAERLLGRRYGLSGRVAHGDKRGRTLGVPTANIHLAHHVSLAGIFVVEVTGLGDRPRPAVASIGTRPTVGGKDVLLETHLLDYSGEFYGTRLTVNFLHKLREERRFASLAELKVAMNTDIDAARDYFRRHRAQFDVKPL